MGETPITGAQFSTFVADTHYKADTFWKDNYIKYLKHPAVYVSWEDSVAFCNWLSKICGLQIRLPSQKMWEKGARGIDGRNFPWGDTLPTSELANYGKPDHIQNLSPVGQYSPKGDSPYGLQDMAGNVWELCQDIKDREQRVFTRGGAFNYYGNNFLHTYYQATIGPRVRSKCNGFRIIALP